MNDPLEQTQRLPAITVQARRNEGMMYHTIHQYRAWAKRMAKGRTPKPLAFGVDSAAGDICTIVSRRISRAEAEQMWPTPLDQRKPLLGSGAWLQQFGRAKRVTGLDGHTKATEADHHARMQRDGFPGDDTQ
jgi:hypothetical protein